ncbi:hypothetical protein H4Q26_005713 [Puccinia striiformis f. sp. tritici PST-130]|nr:hypothetical protein H4Q26_005713 [Puccinia striiformis f. sp. tritici PST-130]
MLRRKQSPETQLGCLAQKTTAVPARAFADFNKKERYEFASFWGQCYPDAETIDQKDNHHGQDKITGKHNLMSCQRTVSTSDLLPLSEPEAIIGAASAARRRLAQTI